MLDDPKARLFKDLRLGLDESDFKKPLLSDSQYVEITDSLRLYYSIDDFRNKSGFNAVVVHFYSATGNTDDHWLDPEYEVHVLLRAWAAFDGIRHMYLGENGSGYLHYPDPEAWMIIMECLKKLEFHHCSDIGHDTLLPNIFSGI